VLGLWSYYERCSATIQVYSGICHVLGICLSCFSFKLTPVATSSVVIPPCVYRRLTTYFLLMFVRIQNLNTKDSQSDVNAHLKLCVINLVALD
jgi:hypothetical protein